MKKSLLCIIMICLLVFSFAVYAEEAAQATPAPANEMQMPGGGRAPGGRGSMVGEMPDMPEGEIPPMPGGERPAMPNGEMPAAPTNETGDSASFPDMRQGMGGRGGMPGQMPNFNMQQETETAAAPTGVWGFLNTYATHISTGIALIFGFLFVIFYKRKNY